MEVGKIFINIGKYLLIKKIKRYARVTKDRVSFIICHPFFSELTDITSVKTI